MALNWQEVPETAASTMPASHYTFRAAVPGGWLVAIWAGEDKKNACADRWGGGLTFVPDPDHAWDPDEDNQV